MQSPHERAKDTQEMIERFREAAVRRRRLLWVFGGAVAVVMLGMIVALIVLTRPGPAQTAAAGLTSTTDTADSSAEADPTPPTLPPAVATVPETTNTTMIARSYVVVIDPGHQAAPNGGQEPIGPGASQTKDKVSSGTRSINTGEPESELVLAVALRLRDSLETEGIQVIMTRTTQDVDISNQERAQLANDSRADLFVRIHADGAEDTSLHGILVLYPATVEGWTDDIAVESKRAARLALAALVEATGAKERGLSARADITGFNWSDVPVILPEIGMMTNPAEDALLATDDYQAKIARGLTDSILDYLGVR